MVDVMNRLMNAWASLLDGHVNVPVYRVDAPPTDTDYVIIRPEASSDRSNNVKFVNTLTIITEVVVRFESGELINETAAHDIDGLIANLVLPNPPNHNLPVQSGIQVVSIKRQDVQYIPEDDGVNRYYRIITRNIHRVEQ